MMTLKAAAPEEAEDDEDDDDDDDDRDDHEGPPRWMSLVLHIQGRGET
jgi:hypothetical protein